MGFLKNATVEGINAALEARGLISWSDPKLAEFACHHVSTKLGGPEELKNGLSKQAAVEIANLLKQAHATMVGRGMKILDAGLHRKQANERDMEAYAFERAAACMRKVAGDGSLTPSGENTPEAAAGVDQIAKLDQENRSTMEYVVGVGNTTMPSGGQTGEQMAHPKAPASSPDTPNSAAKLSEFEARISALNLDPEKLATLIVHGNTPEVRAAALKVASAGKPAFPGAAKPFGSKNLSEKLKEKKADDMSGLPGGMPGATPPMGMGMGAEPPAAHGSDPTDILMALQAAGIDPASVDPEALLQALQMGSAAPGGAPGGAPGAEAPAGPPAGSPPAAKPEKSESKSDDKEKEAAYLERLRKLAEGDGSLTSSEKNTPESAAKTDQIAKLDQENRSTTEYVQEQGKSNLGENGEGQQYHIQDAPKAPSVNPDTTASRETKSAASMKISEEEQEYVAAVEKIAQQYGPKLPATMPKNEKIAHLKNLLALSPQHRGNYVSRLLGK